MNGGKRNKSINEKNTQNFLQQNKDLYSFGEFKDINGKKHANRFVEKGLKQFWRV